MVPEKTVGRNFLEAMAFWVSVKGIEIFFFFGKPVMAAYENIRKRERVGIISNAQRDIIEWTKKNRSKEMFGLGIA